jgi:hypothetical protein
MAEGCDVRNPDIITPHWKMRERSDKKVVKQAHVCQTKDVSNL